MFPLHRTYFPAFRQVFSIQRARLGNLAPRVVALNRRGAIQTRRSRTGLARPSVVPRAPIIDSERCNLRPAYPSI